MHKKSCKCISPTTASKQMEMNASKCYLMSATKCHILTIANANRANLSNHKKVHILTARLIFIDFIRKDQSWLEEKYGEKSSTWLSEAELANGDVPTGVLRLPKGGTLGQKLVDREDFGELKKAEPYCGGGRGILSITLPLQALIGMETKQIAIKFNQWQWKWNPHKPNFRH